METLPTTTTRTPFQYTGDGLELALLMLKNLFFTIITLGIYRPWATTNMRRYNWGHMTFLGDRANYTGTGGELFRGWVKLALLLMAGGLVVRIASAIVEPLALIIFLIYLLVFALATYSGLRYRMSRTQWRQIRFGVDKDERMTKEFIRLYVFGTVLTALTLGIYLPWFRNSVRTFLTNKSRMGRTHFSYDGPSDMYAWIFWSGFVLSLLTLGIYAAWWTRNLARFRLEHTRFMGQNFELELSGLQILGYYVAALGLTLFTFGLATPWVYVWGMRLFADNTFISAVPDLSSVENEYSDGSAMADEIVMGYDLDLGF